MYAPHMIYSAEAWDVPPSVAEESRRLSNDDLNKFLDHVLPRHGRQAWRMRRKHNLVTDEGARWLITHAFNTPASVAWYVGFKGSGTPDNSHTMASHTAWSEITTYSQTARPQLIIPVIVSGRSSSNSANKASITASGSASVYGFFVCSVSTKGGSSGLLYSIVDYGSAQAVSSGQIMRTTVTVEF